MFRNSYSSAIARAMLAGVSAAPLLIGTPLVTPSLFPAAAQVRVDISVEFRTALTPYGTWRTVNRWGEVWVPARTAREWQPYTVGTWVYSDDYGWYWISEASEAEWGWVAYHYGRWAFDDTYGWVWVPGNEWGPAWVDWRRGDEYVGWAPLPPDEVIVEYRTNPRFWIFVRPAQLLGPRLAFLPLAQRQTIIQRTVVVNRTVMLSDRRFAVNPGIAPAIIAAAARQPVRSVQVRPAVVAGTANISGATEVRAEDLRRGGNRPGQNIARESVVQKTVATVEPAKSVPPPQALGNNEGGRLGDHPPRAAVNAQDRGTTGATGTPPANQRQEGTAPSQQREERNRAQDRGTPGAPPPANQRQEGTAPRPQREGAAPTERGSQTPETRQTLPRDERNRGQDRGTTGSTGAPPTNQRQEGTPPRQQREGAAPPAERGNQTPESRGQTPPRDERNRGPEDRRSQAPAPQVQPTPPPTAKAPAVPPSPPARTNAAPAQQDEKKNEDPKRN